MHFTHILQCIGGLVFFLYGMQLMSQSLQACAKDRLKSKITSVTSSPWKGFLVGAGITAMIQSSSATTVMIVSLVNSSMMSLRQAIYVIMGANVGTTITAWILSLSGIESSHPLILLCKPIHFAPILGVIGLFLIMKKRTSLGSVFLGFTILIFGMDQMSQAMASLDGQAFLRLVDSPFTGFLLGASITAILQSSSASIGMLQAVCMTSSLSLTTIIPIVLGQNIGTCITALLSGLSVQTNGKRAAIVHLCFNTIGSIAWFLLYFMCYSSIPYIIVTPMMVAGFHTIFNVTCSLGLLPFSAQLERLVCTLVSEGQKKSENA